MSSERIDLSLPGSLDTELHVLGRGPTATLRLYFTSGHADAQFHGDELLKLRDWISDNYSYSDVRPWQAVDGVECGALPDGRSWDPKPCVKTPGHSPDEFHADWHGRSWRGKTDG